VLWQGVLPHARVRLDAVASRAHAWSVMERGSGGGTAATLRARVPDVKEPAELAELCALLTQPAETPLPLGGSKTAVAALVMAGMRAHPSCAPLQVAGCKALLPSVQAAAAAPPGAINALLAALKGHAAHAGVQEAGFNALACATAQDADAALAAVAGGALVILALCQRAHADDASLQVSASLAAFALLLHGRVCASAGVVRGGGVEVATAALRTMTGVADDIAFKGCEVLGMLLAVWKPRGAQPPPWDACA
jgi:hypothetical protein